MLTETVTFTQHYQDQKQGPNGPWTKNTFVAEDGRRFETSKAAIAAQLAAGLSLPTTIAFEQKVNGQYTNLIVTGVLEQTTQPASGGNGTAPAPAPQQQASYRDLSIQRQVAFKGTLEAFHNNGIDSVAHLEEAKEYAQEWVDFLENGYTPIESPPEGDEA